MRQGICGLCVALRSGTAVSLFRDPSAAGEACKLESSQQPGKSVS